MSIVLTKTEKAVMDGLLTLVGLVGGQLATGIVTVGPPGVLPIVGAFVGYIASDALNAVNTSTAPTAAVIANQSVNLIQQALAVPGISTTQRQALEVALSVAQSEAKSA